MKKSFILLSGITLFSVFLFSCNKDDTTSPGGGTTSGPQTTSFVSTPDKTIAPNSWTTDSLNANITTGISAQSVSDIKLNLNNLESVIAQNLKFTLVHNGIEVYVIDTLTASGTGNMTNTILSDSSPTSISSGGYSYTGVFKPSHPLNAFFNSEPAGVWSLRIYNSGSFRTGVIKSWGITITYFPTIQIPSLNSAYFPAIGDNWKFKRADTTNSAFSLKGENVTWDFSGLAVNNSIEYTDEFLQPSVSPLYWHFPQSNLARRNFDLYGNYTTFYNSDLNNGNYFMFGEADSNASDGFKVFELIPYIYIAWSPFTYNSMRIDYGLTNNITPSYTANGKFVDTVKADGWGRILLPGGASYNNVLRHRIVVATMDTINHSTLSYTFNETINWFSVGFKFPVLQYIFSMRYSVGIGSSWTKYVNYTTQNVPINK